MIQAAREGREKQETWVPAAPDVARTERPAPSKVQNRREPDLCELQVPKGEDELREFIREQERRRKSLDEARDIIDHFTWFKADREEYLHADFACSPLRSLVIGGLGAIVGATIASIASTPGYPNEILFCILTGLPLMTGALVAIRDKIYARKDAAWCARSIITRVAKTRLPDERQTQLLRDASMELAEEREGLKKSISLVSKRLEQTYGEEMRKREEQAHEMTLQDVRQMK